jgi:hypothetical protein
MRKRFLSCLTALFFCVSFSISAQDFGFGFGDEADTAGSLNTGGGGIPAVAISGEVSASLLAYPDDFSEGADHTRLGDIFSGKLNFSASTSVAEGVIALKLTPTDSPIAIDEAYVRAYYGGFDIEAGLRKLTWGKADSFGPLDVVNPLDYTDLSEMEAEELMKIKIARPLVHTSLRLGQFSKAEAVFVPTFEPYRFASGGRWAPIQLAGMTESIAGQLVQATSAPMRPYAAAVLESRMSGLLAEPDTGTIDYFQAGLRFTTTIVSSDIGVQYYYGRLPMPATGMVGFSASLPGVLGGLSTAADQNDVNTALSGLVPPVVAYNPYHQIGVDYAQVLAGFNVRAEFAANITEDLSGDDGTVYNPHLAWSLGFDHDLVWGINLNLQCNETICLLDNKVNNNPLLDVEADSDITATRITAMLSKKFFRDEIEVRAAMMWGVENNDFLIMPAFVWTKDSVSVELSGGIFGGDEDGQFGQFRDNGFIKAAITYSF